MTVGNDTWAGTVLRCLVEKEERLRHCQIEYADTYWRMLETATKKSVENVRSLVNDWYWEAVTVEEDGMNSEKKKETGLGMTDTGN